MRKKEFNENDILGDVERDSLGQPTNLVSSASQDTFFDKRGREVSRLGYLIDKDGNIINQEG